MDANRDNLYGFMWPLLVTIGVVLVLTTAALILGVGSEIGGFQESRLAEARDAARDETVLRSVTVTVVDETGDLVRGAHVEIVPATDRASEPVRAWAAGWRVAASYTGSRGTVRIDRVVPRATDSSERDESAAVGALPERFPDAVDRARSPRLVVRREGSATVDIPLPRALATDSLTVRLLRLGSVAASLVTTETAQPLAGPVNVRFEWAPASPGQGGAAVDAGARWVVREPLTFDGVALAFGGHLRLAGLPPGRYSMTIAAADRTSTTVPIEIVPGEVARAGRVGLGSSR